MSDRLSLTAAGMRLRLTYHQVRARLLRGELEGGCDELGRYYVLRAAVDRAETAQHRPESQAPESPHG